NVATNGAEEVDRSDIGEALAEARDLRAKLVDRFRLSPGPQQLDQVASIVGDIFVVGVAGLIEKLLDLLVRKPVNQTRLAHESLTSSFNDLPQQPFKILLSSFIHGQRVDRVFDRDCANAL